MTLDNFRHKLKKACPQLRVVSNSSAKKNPWAGIEVRGFEAYKPDEEGKIVGRLPVCSVNKEGMPRDRSILRNDGRILTKSLRDTLFTLLRKGHITQEGSIKYFGMRLDRQHPPIKEAPDAIAVAVANLRRSGALSSYAGENGN